MRDSGIESDPRSIPGPRARAIAPGSAPHTSPGLELMGEILLRSGIAERMYGALAQRLS